MAAFSFVEHALPCNGDLLIPEKTHTDVKLFVLVAAMYHFPQGIQYVGAPVIPDVHGDAKDVADIAWITGEKTNPLHREIQAHQG